MLLSVLSFRVESVMVMSSSGNGCDKPLWNVNYVCIGLTPTRAVLCWSVMAYTTAWHVVGDQ